MRDVEVLRRLVDDRFFEEFARVDKEGLVDIGM